MHSVMNEKATFIHVDPGSYQPQLSESYTDTVKSHLRVRPAPRKGWWSINMTESFFNVILQVFFTFSYYICKQECMFMTLFKDVKKRKLLWNLHEIFCFIFLLIKTLPIMYFNHIIFVNRKGLVCHFTYILKPKLWLLGWTIKNFKIIRF